MTFRTRLVLIFTIAVTAAVGVVELIVSGYARRAFETTDAHRMDTLVTQIDREFQRRGQEIVRTVESIAASSDAHDLTITPEPSPDRAAQSAATHGLDLLEFVGGDGVILSSAQRPASYLYKEDWLTEEADWKARGAFLKREELPDGMALGLMAVGINTVGDRKLFVAGGQKLDREFLSKLVTPQGMRVLLYRNLQPQFSSSELVDATGPAVGSDTLQPLIEQVRQGRHELTRTVGRGTEAFTFFAKPLIGYENNLLGVLLIGSSRRELVQLESSMLSTAIVVASMGILMGIAMSWWATARITRPVRQLAESAGKVASGNWGTTVAVTSNDEIGQLAGAFNRMTRELVDQRDKLVQAERVAAWRELARRLAHELKNPLFPLQITVENMQRARESYPDQFDDVFREGTSTLLAELANLKQIIGRFSDFAKMPAPEMQTVDLNRVAAETMKLFDAQLAKAGVRGETQLDPALRPVQADPEQMTRVLRNLVLNAIDAMPQGGTLTVRTKALANGARLEISDTGQGLTPEECERLFTPYYTTKTHGTGLGLAIVQSVVSDHKGRISVESEKGRGTTFRIELG